MLVERVFVNFCNEIKKCRTEFSTPDFQGERKTLALLSMGFY